MIDKAISDSLIMIKQGTKTPDINWGISWVRLLLMSLEFLFICCKYEACKLFLKICLDRFNFTSKINWESRNAKKERNAVFSMYAQIKVQRPKIMNSFWLNDPVKLLIQVSFWLNLRKWPAVRPSITGIMMPKLSISKHPPINESTIISGTAGRTSLGSSAQILWIKWRLFLLLGKLVMHRTRFAWGEDSRKTDL